MPPVCHEGLGQPVRVPPVGSQPDQISVGIVLGKHTAAGSATWRHDVGVPIRIKEGSVRADEPIRIGEVVPGFFRYVTQRGGVIRAVRGRNIRSEVGCQNIKVSAPNRNVEWR